MEKIVNDLWGSDPNNILGMSLKYLEQQWQNIYLYQKEIEIQVIHCFEMCKINIMVLAAYNNHND